jgi:hypothetical protein
MHSLKILRKPDFAYRQKKKERELRRKYFPETPNACDQGFIFIRKKQSE